MTRPDPRRSTYWIATAVAVAIFGTAAVVRGTMGDGAAEAAAADAASPAAESRTLTDAELRAVLE